MKLNPPSKLYPEDGNLVGTDAIFSSTNVIPPPNTKPQKFIPLPPPNDGIPTPSTYFDDRGEIHNIRIHENNQRINILYTKAGYLRSGDIHPNEQCDFIFSGKVNLWTLSKDGSTIVTTYCKHEFIKIPRGVPHVFDFLEDTVMAEWWEPQGFQPWFYRPYREIVDASFRFLTNTLVANKDDCSAEECKINVVDRSRQGLVVLAPCYPDGFYHKWKHIVILAGAAVVGMSGFALGRKSGCQHQRVW